MNGVRVENETLVYILVEAQQRPVAVRRAKSTMESLVDAVSRPVESFHGYHMFHGEDVSQLKERWGNQPEAVPLNSETGDIMLEEAWERAEKSFEHDIEKVKELLGRYSTEELMENAENVRRYFLRLGATVGPSVLLYSESGYPIRDRRELDRYLTSHGEKWIVPVVGVC